VAGSDGQKVFLEFDGIRQAGHFFLNGQSIGKYENDITAVGFDITKFVKYSGQDNILAVKIDNNPNYKEEGAGYLEGISYDEMPLFLNKV